MPDSRTIVFERSASSVTREVETRLADFMRSVRPERTLETGMGLARSRLCICQAHRDNHGRSRCHTAIGPMQESTFQSGGLANIERAGFKDPLCFYQAPSCEVLPELLSDGETFDFVFIDGNHRFDYALVDFFYISRLLAVGGHIAFDDLWIPAVRKVVSYVLKNAAYIIVEPPSRIRVSPGNRVLRSGRRILQNPLGRDWPLKLVPYNLLLREKLSDHEGTWSEHRAF
jgi:predicted O-methyltransferase YrrM